MEKVRVDRSPKESPLAKWVSYRSSSRQYRPRCSFKWSIYLSAHAPYKVPRSTSLPPPTAQGERKRDRLHKLQRGHQLYKWRYKNLRKLESWGGAESFLSRKVRKKDTSKENKTSVIAQILVH